MKKLLITLMLIQLSAPLFAERIYLPQRVHKLELLDVDDAVSAAQQNTAKQANEWKIKLNTIRKQFQLVKRSFTPNTLPAVHHVSLSPREETTYMQRVFQLQTLLNQNPDLKGLSFTAPEPYDLAHLTSEKMEMLSGFLKNKPTARPTFCEQVRPFTLAVRLGNKATNALEIWIDVPTKKVYLMSDNFYTTANGKYSLHLR